ncbi:uncharacterized protein LOC144747585 [Ciona intestinalis]
MKCMKALTVRNMRNQAFFSTKDWSNFLVRRLTEENVVQAQALVTNHFSKQDEMRKALGISLDNAIEFDRIKTKELVQNGASLGIFEKSSHRLVGAAFSKIEARSNYSHGFSVMNEHHNSSKWIKPILDVHKSLGENVFSELKADKILAGRILVVDSAYAQHGVATLLMQGCTNLATELECDLVLGYVTSNFSANIARKSGFKIISSLDLLQYVDEATGQKPFVNAKPPHNMVHLCCYRVPKAAL